MAFLTARVLPPVQSDVRLVTYFCNSFRHACSGDGPPRLVHGCALRDLSVGLATEGVGNFRFVSDRGLAATRIEY